MHVDHPTLRFSRRAAPLGRAIVAHRDASLCARLKWLLRIDRFDVATFRDGCSAVNQLASWMVCDGRTADVVIVGPRLRGWSGVELARHLPHTAWGAPVLLVLDGEEGRTYTDQELERRTGVPFVFRAPYQDEDLRTVARLLAERRQRLARAGADRCYCVPASLEEAPSSAGPDPHSMKMSTRRSRARDSSLPSPAVARCLPPCASMAIRPAGMPRPTR